MKRKFPSNFQLYKTIVDFSIKNALNKKKYMELKSKLEEFQNLTDKIAQYMLETRFEPSKPKARKPKSDISPDLRLFLYDKEQLKKPEQFAPPKFLDIIKFYKLLENFILSRRDRRKEISDLELGSFSEVTPAIYDSLTKLLFDVKLVDSGDRGNILAIIFSIVCVYRQFQVTPSSTSKTIVAEYSGTRSLEEILNNEFSDYEIDKWLDTIENLESLKPFLNILMYSGNASSPNSGASGINLLMDAGAIRSDLRLLNAIRNISRCFGNSEAFLLVLDTFGQKQKGKNWFKEFNFETGKRGDPIQQVHSRIVTFSAPGGKQRVIAIVDWATQTALSAIHYSLFKFLTLLSSDRTFDHPSGLDIFSPDKNIYHSVDLSAATDRLPRILQARLLARLYSRLGLDGDVIASNWLELMDREFVTKGSAFEKEQKTISYKVGQGMGMFSSWVSLSLTHHYIVNHVCGCNRDNYRLVGDDLILADSSEPFTKYKNFLVEIGMELNDHKTIISDKAPFNLEFARNYIIDGHKIHPLPIGVAFAWLNGTLPTETIIWAFKSTFKERKAIELINLLEQKHTDSQFLVFIYYLLVNKIISYDLASLQLRSRVGTKHLNPLMLWKVHHITRSTSNDQHTTWHQQEVGKFLSTLESQCVMRKEQELIEAVAVAKEIYPLKYTYGSLGDAANKLFWRLTNASLIEYTPDIIGGPLTSKRERNLLSAIVGVK